MSWYRKPVAGSEHWKELEGRQALEEAVLCKDGKPTVVDFFAGYVLAHGRPNVPLDTQSSHLVDALEHVWVWVGARSRR